MDAGEGGELVELTRRECLGLLAGGVIGRVVCTDGALPTRPLRARAPLGGAAGDIRPDGVRRCNTAS
jgi:hypothetical protein